MFVVTRPTWKALSPHGSQSNDTSYRLPHPWNSALGRCQLRNHVSAAGLVARRNCTGSGGSREPQRCRHRISREAVQLDDRISETVHCDDSHVRATVDVKAILSDPGIEGNPLEFLKVTEAYWKVWSSSPALQTIKTLCTMLIHLATHTRIAVYLSQVHFEDCTVSPLPHCPHVHRESEFTTLNCMIKLHMHYTFITVAEPLHTVSTTSLPLPPPYILYNALSELQHIYPRNI